MPKKDSRVEFNILGRVYPVNSKDLDSEKVEEVSSFINHQISQYKIRYAQLDNQDCLSMALIEKYLDTQGNDQEVKIKNVNDKLDELNHLLDQFA